MDLTARCNLKCVMCYFSNTDRLFFPPFDTQLSDDGNMPVAVFEKIAADLFPRAWRVALACAAEPMIHPAVPRDRRRSPAATAFRTSGSRRTCWR